MPRLSLSNVGDLKVSGEFLNDENIIFSLSTFGDLTTNGLVAIAEPNIDNPNLILSIGVNGTTLYGTAEKLLPPEPNPNLINPDENYVYDSGTIILEETVDYLIITSQWEETGILFPIYLEPNKTYIVEVDIEILESTENSTVRVGAFNVDGDDYISYNIDDTTSEIGIIQKLSGTITTPSYTGDEDLIEVEIMCVGDGNIKFKVYKESMIVQEI